MPENKILVVRGGAIGDFILTLPVLAALRQQFPRTRLEVLGYPHIVQLAVAGGLADAVRPIEARALAGFFARGGTLAPELANYFGSFAIIVSYLYDPDAVFRENVARVAGAQFIVGPHRPDESVPRHAAEVLLKPLERLAIFAADPVPRLRLGHVSDVPGALPYAEPAGERAVEARCATRDFRSREGVPALALHPGSGSERKNWPERCWRELLARLLEETEFRLLIVAGEAEADRVARLATSLSSARVELALNQPLAELAARLSGCCALVGHDSGISHLAAAVGVPVLALWGETSEAIWRPAGERVRLLRGGAGLGRISVANVLDALRELLAQRSP